MSSSLPMINKSYLSDLSPWLMFSSVSPRSGQWQGRGSEYSHLIRQLSQRQKVLAGVSKALGYEMTGQGVQGGLSDQQACVSVSARRWLGQQKSGGQPWEVLSQHWSGGVHQGMELLGDISACCSHTSLDFIYVSNLRLFNIENFLLGVAQGFVPFAA